MLQMVLSFLFNIRLLDVIDILLVALLLYALYNLLKGTAAINIFFGIVAFFLVWKVVKILEMELLTEILGAFISVGFIALIVVFQPEIRKFLLLLGTPGFRTLKRKRFMFWRIHLSDFYLDTDTIVQACHNMALSKTGAILVIALKNELQEYVRTGELIEARISEQLIENIFFKNSPLHDGAVIVVNNKLKAARCILPVSKNQNIPIQLGLRHRSAVGITERSDSIAIVVSEQTGRISYCKNGVLTTRVEPAQLKNFLDKELNIN